MSLVLVVPALIGADTNLLLHIAALVVGVQAAQSSVIQVGRSLDSALCGRPWLLAIPAAIFGVLEMLTATDPVVDAVLSTVSGSFLGLLLGRAGLLVLGGKGGTAFQAFQAMKALGFVAAACAAALADRVLPGFGPLVATLTVGLLAIFRPRVGRRRMGYSKPEPLTRGTGLSVTMGLLASLFYRNDVNWVRTALADSDDFIVWHYGLIAYSAVQGIVGFLVVQLFFSHRQKWKIRVQGWCLRFGFRFALVWAILVAVAILLLPALPIIQSVLGSALLAGIVGILSGLSHVVEISWAPYLAGVLGAGTLSLALVLHVDARMVIVLENVVIGSIIILLILIFRRRQWNSFN
ncbi:hypothetical protein FCN77_20220 [Arthrobacter sp. 24S4-2]|uniref:hypothetical protein n=1 Tax=Arthrobacter sp. 24S4-2 TaxID=2575374 RepID=UPI0010C7933E|nr:hypothetical protein [Arthrobacter sp. 24S4-2]QCO99608.1 hypothetical protein FCN77_20220 [Arthrobacter sp. 24S4-2]